MFEYLINLDKELFLLINGCHNTFFDLIMTYVSSKFFWIWFYLVLLYFIIRQYKWYSILVLIFVTILITFSDQASVHLFKNTIQRLRPCHNEEIMLVVHTVNGCGGKYGFVSSHAANTFALAFFISGLLEKENKWLPLTMFLWAVLVGYSRVYLGVHYPGDILGGAIVGIIIGMMVLMVFRITEKRLMKTTSSG